jgi:hypothetical protein
MAIKIGTVLEVPEVRGKWATWSKADAGPGAWFLVPADDAARAVGRSYITARLVDGVRPQVAKLL